MSNHYVVTKKKKIGLGNMMEVFIIPFSLFLCMFEIFLNKKVFVKDGGGVDKERSDYNYF